MLFFFYFDSKSKKSGKLDNAMQSVRKQKFNQHASRVTDPHYSEKNTIETNVDNESEDTSFSEEAASGPTKVSPTIDYLHYLYITCRYLTTILGFLPLFCRRKIKMQVVRKQSPQSHKTQQKK